MSTYKTNFAKWQAFKYKDPFAADKFFVCHTGINLGCRPHCDLGFSFKDTNQIVFVNSINDVIDQGFDLCQHCLPNYQKQSANDNNDLLANENFVAIDLNLLHQTLKSVNKNVGFIPPLVDFEDPVFLSTALKQVRNKDLKNKLLSFSNDLKPESNISNSSDITTGDKQRNLQSKNDFEHLKLIDMACRHIALTAISTLFGVSLYFNNDKTDINHDSNSNPKNESTSPLHYDILQHGLDAEIENEINDINDELDDFDSSDDQNSHLSDSANDIENNITNNNDANFGIINKGSYYIQHQQLKSKKRRGGVLGFKELASKSQLSPWHFHRTFRTMTGVTPKQYGDKCFRYLDSKKHKIYQSLSSPNTIIMNVRLANPSHQSKNNGSIVSISSENLATPRPSISVTRLSLTSVESIDSYSQSSPLVSATGSLSSDLPTELISNDYDFHVRKYYPQYQVHPQDQNIQHDVDQVLANAVNDQFTFNYNHNYNYTNNNGNNNNNNKHIYDSIQSSTLEYQPLHEMQTSPLDLEFIKLANNSLNNDNVSDVYPTEKINQQNNLEYYTSNDQSLNYSELSNINLLTPKASTTPLSTKTFGNNLNLGLNLGLNLNSTADGNNQSGNTTRKGSTDISYQTLPTSNSLSMTMNDNHFYNELVDENILSKQLQLQSFLEKKTDHRLSVSSYDADNADLLNWPMEFKDLTNSFN